MSERIEPDVWALKMIYKNKVKLKFWIENVIFNGETEQKKRFSYQVEYFGFWENHLAEEIIACFEVILKSLLHKEYVGDHEYIYRENKHKKLCFSFSN